jgi:hypothetical protein
MAGVDAPYWFAVDVEKGRLHLHGGIACNDNKLERVRRALCAAGGQWAADHHANKQCDLQPLYAPDVWANYALRNKSKARRLIAGKTVTITTLLRRHARRHYHASGRGAGRMHRVTSLLLLALAGCNPQTTNQAQLVAADSPPSSICLSAAAGGRIKEVDVNTVLKILRTGDFKKKEFETSDEFKKRTASHVQQANKYATDGTLAFFVPIPESHLKYDADTETMQIGREYSGLIQTEFSLDGHFVAAARSSRTTGTYVGSNAFGARKDVTRHEQSVVGIEFAGSDSSLGWPDAFKPYSLAMSRSDAQKSKGALGIIFVGELIPPYYKRDRRRIPPKFDAPYDVEVNSEVIQMYVACAAIYNKAAGKVLEEIKFKRSRY